MTRRHCHATAPLFILGLLLVLFSAEFASADSLFLTYTGNTYTSFANSDSPNIAHWATPYNATQKVTMSFVFVDPAVYPSLLTPTPHCPASFLGDQCTITINGVSVLVAHYF